jgi:GNAT superfamily N-acetyltransferase
MIRQLAKNNTDDINYVLENAQAFDVFGDYVKAFEKWLFDNNVDFYLAFSDENERQGFIALNCQDNSIPVVFVSPMFRRKGIANSLFAYVEDIAHGKGVKKLSCVTAQINEAINSLLLSRHYVDIGFAGIYAKGQNANTYQVTL